MPVPKGKAAWEALAVRALDAFMSSIGAAVWPEIESLLAEQRWVHYNLDSDIPPNRNPDPIHLSIARSRLVETGVLEESSAVLNGRPVSVWLDSRALASRGRKTQVIRLASSKRRLYRRFLGWSGDNRLCGSVAEAIVAATVESLRGTCIWISPGTTAGDVKQLLGRPVEIGRSLDYAGHWALSPDDPAAGVVPFAVEVKNTRSTVYPRDYEVWDLLAKISTFPDVLPVLIARRIHPITFRFLKDVGGLGTSMRRQWFSPRISSSEFSEVVSKLSLADCRQTTDPIEPFAPLTRFFSETVYTPSPSLLLEQLTKWSRTAPFVRRYSDLRDDGLDPKTRRRLWFSFSQELEEEGLIERGGWAPVPYEEEAPSVPDYYL